MKKVVIPFSKKIRRLGARSGVCLALLILSACSTTPQVPTGPTLGEMLAVANVERVDGGVTFVNFGWSPWRAAPCRFANAGLGCGRVGYRYPYFGLYYPYYGWSPAYAHFWGAPGWGYPYFPGGWSHYRPGHWWYFDRHHDRGYAPIVANPGEEIADLPPISPMPVGVFDDFAVKPGVRPSPGGPVWTISPEQRPGFPAGRQPPAGTSLSVRDVQPMTVRSRGDAKPGVSRAQLPVQRSRPTFSRPSTRSAQPRSMPRSRPAARPAVPSAPRVRTSRPTGAVRISSEPQR